MAFGIYGMTAPVAATCLPSEVAGYRRELANGNASYAVASSRPVTHRAVVVATSIAMSPISFASWIGPRGRFRRVIVADSTK